MNIKQAKEYYNLNVISKIHVVTAKSTPGIFDWLIVLEGNAGQSWTLKTALGKDKVFRSLDTVTEEINSIIGKFSGFTIEL